MAVKMLKVMALGMILMSSTALAQSLRQIGGPANAPPAGFAGQQFVDSRGCLFLRAGYGAGVNWVARVDRGHKPICNMLPTGGTAAQAAVAADMAPDPQARPQAAATSLAAALPAPVTRGAVVAVRAPARQVAAPSPGPQPKVYARVTAAPANPAPVTPGTAFAMQAPPLQLAAPTPAAQPTVFARTAAQPADAAPLRQTGPSYQGMAVATSVAGVQCFDTAPMLERVNVSGGTALVCTRGNGTAAGWRPPMVASAAGARVAAQTVPLIAVPAMLAAPTQGAGVQMASVQVTVAVPQPRAAQPVAVRSHALPNPPKGWVYAWKDDRLNPLRGVGTAQGQAEQDQVWQQTIPMVLVGDPPPQTAFQHALGIHPKVRTARASTTVSTTVSTMSAAPASNPVTRQTSQTAAPVVQVSATPEAPQGSGSMLIQVGCFGDPANAQAVIARLSSLGLPVTTAQTTRKGKVLQIVYAGPFGSGADASSGLATVHGAGYGDAFLR